MKIYNDISHNFYNKQNTGCLKSNVRNAENIEFLHSSIPVSTLKAYSLSFGSTKPSLGVWMPNLDTCSIEYTLPSPYKDAQYAVLCRKKKIETQSDNEVNVALSAPCLKNSSGNFLFSLPILNRKDNSIIDDEIEVEKIVFYNKEFEELGEKQLNETIFPKSIMSGAIPKGTIKIKSDEYIRKIDIISEASVEGKFVKTTYDEISKYNGQEPIIAFFDNPKDLATLSSYLEYSNIHPNVKGIIGVIDNFDVHTLNGLTHGISRIRGRVAIACVDRDTAEFLSKSIASIDAPYLKMKAEPNSMEIKGINKLTAIKKTTATIPHNDMVDKILLPRDAEFTQSAAGLKAYNLGELKKLQTGGNFKVPEFCVVPAGMLARMELPEDFDQKVKNIDAIQDPVELEEGLKELRKVIINSKLPEDVIPEIRKAASTLLDNNLQDNKDRCLIARSSFNGEDSDSMATQGLYDSFPGLRNEIALERGIKQVAASKWSSLAYKSRKYNSIPHTAVQPNVIIQEVVPVDYTFTIYTADPRTNNKNKMMIDLSQGVSCACFGNPYIFEYDRNTKKSKRTQLAQKTYMQPIEEMPNPLLSTLNMLNCDYSKDPLNKPQKEYAPIMDKIFNVAKYIEDNFGGRPQDIEGGIIFKRDKNGEVIDVDVYIWQTRDAHLIKRK